MIRGEYMTDLKLSIIVPNYNDEEYLSNAILYLTAAFGCGIIIAPRLTRSRYEKSKAYPSIR